MNPSPAARMASSLLPKLRPTMRVSLTTASSSTSRTFSSCIAPRPSTHPLPLPRRLTNPLPFPRHNSSSSSSQPRFTTGGRSIPFMIVLGIMPVFTFSLGTWQIKRLQWKLDLIERLEDKLHQDTVRLPARIDPAAIPEFEYRKVYLEGTFDHSKEILLGPRTREGELGFHVITPLVRGEGKDTVLVNRGFVKRERRERGARPEGETEGRVQVTGMLRNQDQSNSFTPQNTPEKEEWVFSDINQMAKHAGTEPVLVDEIFGGHAGEISMRVARGIPVGRAATIELRNQHMTYAVTWYALSAATAFMFFRLVKRPPRSVTAAQYRGVS